MARPIEEENINMHNPRRRFRYCKGTEKKASSNNIDPVPKKQPPIFRSMDDIEVIQRRNLERIISH
ncbi:MAG: hypothetical protein LN590_06735 [Rickettsia endosymbiont of Glossina mortisans submortisans]|nr:hypothetical protein [Rickettsia endosymbiont of Glossina mortisans submortisans]